MATTQDVLGMAVPSTDDGASRRRRITSTPRSCIISADSGSLSHTCSTSERTPGYLES
jgi:hypothetical protein